MHDQPLHQPTPHPSPADAVVLTLRRGASIARWFERGVADRERRWVSALRSVYPRVVVVSGGDEAERADAATIEREAGVCVVSAAGPDPVLGPGATLSARVHRVLAGAASVVVQSAHLDDAGRAASIATGLRPLGVRTALVVRAANIPSRRFAVEGNPHLPRAIEAGIIEADAVRHAQMILGVTRDLCGDLAWRYGINPARTRVVPNYVAVDDDAPIVPVADRPEHGLVAVGPLIEGHHHDVLIDAVAMLDADLRDAVRLTIVGDGPGHAALHRRAHDAGVTLRTVARIGHPGLMALIASASIFLHACPYGPQPRPVLEAMALGTPVVAVGSAITPNLLANGVTGITVERTPEAFANALVGMLPDREWRESLGNGAAVRIRRMCGIAQVLRLTVEAHRDAISGDHHAALPPAVA